MVTAAQTAQFRQANNALVVLALRDFRQLWDALPLGDPRGARDLLLDVMPDLVQTYGDTAAVLGADWYDLLRDAPPSAASFRAIIPDPPAKAKVQGSVRWAVGPLFGGVPEESFARLTGATQRLVLQAGRDAVIGSASRDRGVSTGFARIPVGVTCKWCTMIASRGFVYHSAATAGQSNEWHDDCDCIVVPGSHPSQLPEGYDLAALRKAYAHGEGIGRDIPAD